MSHLFALGLLFVGLQLRWENKSLYINFFMSFEYRKWAWSMFHNTWYTCADPSSFFMHPCWNSKYDFWSRWKSSRHLSVDVGKNLVHIPTPRVLALEYCFFFQINWLVKILVWIERLRGKIGIETPRLILHR